ncbi:MAG: type I glyceraldehyde-3-phosphate dehydrogenase [Candidatus Bathyarchaeia archaeon]
MAKINVAINGFGRIGRLLFRAAIERNANINFVAVNDLVNAKSLAHLLKYDSNFGRFNAEVEAQENSIIVNGKELKVCSQRDPAQLPWKDLDVTLVVESTGRFRSRDQASKHIQAGAKKVLISAPSSDPDITVILGVNDHLYDPDKHHLISNASCTTNCVAPVADVLNKSFGMRAALMTTVHSYTNDQRLLDLVHPRLERARAAALNIIPTSTGAAVATTVILPELKGKMNGLSLRVPTPTVSIVDLVAHLNKKTTTEEINNAFKTEAQGRLKGILDYTELPLVSRDFLGDPHSAIVDGRSTMVVAGDLVKVLAWYDNEWGFSCRMVELIEKVGRLN